MIHVTIQSISRLHSRGDKMPHADSPLWQTPPELLLQVWLSFYCYPGWSRNPPPNCVPNPKLFSSFYYSFKTGSVRGPTISRKAPSAICLVTLHSLCVYPHCAVLFWQYETMAYYTTSTINSTFREDCVTLCTSRRFTSVFGIKFPILSCGVAICDPCNFQAIDLKYYVSLVFGMRLAENEDLLEVCASFLN
jgi:hypothetical protein